MMQGRSAPAVAMPRKYVRAVMRGLRYVLWRQPGVQLTHSHSQMLDVALRYVAAYQQRCAKRLEEINLGMVPHGSDSCLGREETAFPESVRTLHHLVTSNEESKGPYVGGENAVLDEQEGGKHTTLTFFERQQARLHAALQQWVVYSSFRCSQTDFVTRQSKVSAVLLSSPSRVVPSSRSSPEGANSLEASIRRRGAQAYVDLLVHHRLSMDKEEEWKTLCALCNPIEKLQQLGDQGSMKRVLELPFAHSSNLDTSWRRGLALLSWAMNFNGHPQQQQLHISSTDIAGVLEQYAQHFGERMQVQGLTHDNDSGGSMILGGATEQAVVTQLQEWWVAARKAEQRNPKLAETCRLDRTALDRIHVEGKRVTLVSSSESAAVSDANFAELLLQGRWEEVLRNVQQVATEALRRQKPFAEAQPKEKEEWEDVACVTEEGAEEPTFTIGAVTAFPSVSTNDVMSVFFNRPRPIVVKAKLWVHATASRLGRVSRALLGAAETQTEAELLRNPPTVGLRSRYRGTEEGDEAQRKRYAKGTPSPALTELRCKVWIHSQLPRHIPHSLVRFEGTNVSMLPYLLRCPAKELAPWFILCTIAAVAQEEQWEHAHKALQRVRTQIVYTLFMPLTFYAAFQEYCTDLVVQLGSLLAPLQVLRVAVRSIFRPPSFYHFYDVLEGQGIPMESTCRQLWWGSLENVDDIKGEKVSLSSQLSRTAITGMGRLRSDTNALRDFFICKAASLRNYHVSTWIEACSKVETLAGLLDILVQELNNYGPPLLSPEAAAALLTAVLLPHLAAGKEEKSNVKKEIVRELGVVYFVVPADRAFGAAPYFKGIYNESYITSTNIDWTASWDGAEALLVGRSIRRSTKYPTTTKEVFFRVDQRRQGRHYLLPTLRFRIPELRVRLMTVDLLKAKLYFDSQGQEQKKEGGTGEITATVELSHTKSVAADKKPAIVARHLPFGVVAINKPAGISTTLHAGYPHLISFLARYVPWKGVGLPVLFQHGLVNRIDVGTSGLVLVANTESSLVMARRASVVDRHVEKTYRALVVHCPPPASRVGGVEECWYLSPEGFIARNVIANGADYSLQLAARDPQKKGRLPLASTDCRPATTMYRVLRYFPKSGVYDVEVRLCSGRRHQIRQHFAQVWHPLVGDGRYHERAKSVGERLGLYRPALHASRITWFPCISDGVGDATNGLSVVATDDLEKTVVECPLPDDMQRALQWLQEEEKSRIGAFPK